MQFDIPPIILDRCADDNSLSPLLTYLNEHQDLKKHKATAVVNLAITVYKSKTEDAAVSSFINISNAVGEEN